VPLPGSPDAGVGVECCDTMFPVEVGNVPLAKQRAITKAPFSKVRHLSSLYSRDVSSCSDLETIRFRNNSGNIWSIGYVRDLIFRDGENFDDLPT
jgi:hypothetical protein